LIAYPQLTFNQDKTKEKDILAEYVFSLIVQAIKYVGGRIILIEWPQLDTP